ncbi:tripartite tricarboxylate transporter permease [Geodermatophilus ruber]|uniref:Putative tricarboxylic transport membrane protein n=1 Tax=Geodermatophilus ruber TaxID=504800 RepID=A0A1I4AKT8_9ACTN|nr:tripartite tricarboxylate transporter permease [Geodermatophilus ruber]SFK56326.1 putative tricarboxylic transport membrane protein [Geodermatophilus ruber]
MDILEGLGQGLAVAFQPTNLLFVFVGVLIGMVIGVLPGLGPTATIALLLPLTFGLEPATAVIMLAGIYYGSMYGGTITSVLLQLPGEASSVVTVIDGHQMARQGRAGAALGIAAIGSAIGGVVATVGLILLAPPLAGLALRLGPPEFTFIAMLGLVLAAYLGTRSFAKSFGAAALGLLLATVGQDPIEGTSRFAFDSINLLGGLDFAAIAMGLFGVGEVLYSLEQRQGGLVIAKKIGRALPSKAEFKQSRGAIGRGSVLGFGLGVLPGGGGMVPPLASYAIEKRFSKNRANFGRGAIEGVAGPETANNAGAQAAFVPLLTLGLPANGVLALMFGALLIQGITPGPQLVDQHPAVFWGVIASMFIGNLLLLVLNIPLIGVFIKILRIPFAVLGPIAAIVTLIGVFTINNDIFDMWVVLAFGAVGYLMRKAGFEPGPLVLAFVLGVIVERSMRQSLLLANGDLDIFVTRPASAVLLAVLVSLVLMAAVQAVRRRRHASPPTGEHDAAEAQLPNGEQAHPVTGAPVTAGQVAEAPCEPGAQR